MEELKRVEEVAFMVGVSAKTINTWYAWKRTNPDNELAKLLPDYTMGTMCRSGQIRLWKKEDVLKIIEFKNRLPRGCKGILGGVTQAHARKQRAKN